MKIGVDSFRGEAPIVTPRALPENAAQLAINCRMQSGDLQSWRQYLTSKELAYADGVILRTIYLLRDEWLSWEPQADVARGLIPGDDTDRIYITCPELYGRPQFTNYTMATTGAEPYPVATRTVGVPGPTDAPNPLIIGPDTSDEASFSVDVADSGGSLVQWTISPDQYAHGGATQVRDSASGNPGASYELLFDDNPGAPAYIYRDFGVGSAASVSMSFDFKFTSGSNNYSQMTAGVMRSIDGADGIVVGWDLGGSFFIGRSSGWNRLGASSLAAVSTTAPAFSTYYTCTITVTPNTDGSQTISATITNLALTVIGTLMTTNNFVLGGYCGFMAETAGSDGVDRYRTTLDNIHVTASGTAGYSPDLLATVYLYTYRNDLAEESAPSPVSSTIARAEGTSVTVTTPTTLPPGSAPDYSIYGITEKVIYRAASGSGGVYKRVAVIPLAQADYVDILNDNEIGPQVLESAEWDLPHDEMEGILPLPNGTMSGFFKNQLCFSAQNRPHAWPVSYRLTTDSDIIAIKNIDTTVVVTTKTYVYTASGSSPDRYAMSQPGKAEAGSSKTGIAYLDKFGVVFASPSGVQRCAGLSSQVDNVTAGIFTARQWKALNPESMSFAVHDDMLVISYDNGDEKGCLLLDLRSLGAGLTRLSAHPTAMHVDPLTDGLYMVLDETDEPTDVLLPLSSTEPTVDGKTIFLFDGDDTSAMVFKWRGKLNLSPYPMTMNMAQVRAESFTNLVLRIYGDTALLKAKRITSAGEFILQTLDTQDSHELEVIGSSTTRSVQICEDVMELS